MREDVRVITLDRYEHGVTITALNDMRNDMIADERPTDVLDDLLLKVIDAPAKKVKVSARGDCPR